MSLDNNRPPSETDIDIKKDGEAQKVEEFDFATGETLSPEEDRRILRKIDLLYGILDSSDGARFTDRTPASCPSWQSRICSNSWISRH